MTLMIQAKWIPKVTVREQSSSTKRSWAIIGRKYSFNEDLFKASQQQSDDPSSTPAAAQPKSNKSATLGASSGSKLLRSSSFSNMLSKDDSGTIGTLVGYFLFSLCVSTCTCIDCSNSSSLLCFICWCWMLVWCFHWCFFTIQRCPCQLVASLVMWWECCSVPACKLTYRSNILTIPFTHHILSFNLPMVVQRQWLCCFHSLSLSFACCCKVFVSPEIFEVSGFTR